MNYYASAFNLCRGSCSVDLETKGCYRDMEVCYPISGAPNGSVPQNICSSGTFLLAGRCGRNNSPWKESAAGKEIIQGVRGDLKSRIAATGYLYGLLTTQDRNCALSNFPVQLSQVAG